MLTSRQLDTEDTNPRRTKRRAKRSTSKPKRPTSGASNKSVQRKLKTANKQAAKAEKARAKAESEHKAAEKALAKANKQAKKNERLDKRDQRQRKRERRQEKREKRSSGSSEATRPARVGLLRDRNSSRKGFERRSSGRIRFAIVAVLAVLSAGVIGAVVYVNSSEFGVTSIEVAGAEKASDEDIIAASLIEIDQNLLEVEPPKVAEQVEKVAWVDQASIDRKWNGSIVISVTERQAVAALESPSGFVLVDNSGRQLEKVPNAPGSQIPVTGVKVSGVIGEEVSAEGLQATNFIGSISPKIRPMVRNIVVDSGRLVAELDVEQIEQGFAAADTSIMANFGTNQELDEKMASLETVLERVDLTCVARIDLSSPSKPTVLRTPAVTNLEKLPTGLVDC